MPLAPDANSPADLVFSLAGNPNVGKSTVFNGLTGLHQHTGNWAGKTVENAIGQCMYSGKRITLMDLPGIYSLAAHSKEEEVARDYLCEQKNDCVIIVCDATCLERNLNLVLQILEISGKAVICLNLMDEAKRKGIDIDLDRLSKLLEVPVAEVVAREKQGLDNLLEYAVDIGNTKEKPAFNISYPPAIEKEINNLLPLLSQDYPDMPGRWLALRLLEPGDNLPHNLKQKISGNEELTKAVNNARKTLADNGYTENELENAIVSSIVNKAANIYRSAVNSESRDYNSTDRKLDAIFTGKIAAYPTMLLLLALVFWITLIGANYPSQWLSSLLFGLQDRLTDWFTAINAPPWLHGVLVLGVYRVMAWVISVMLPPMAIFFPLFTLLEDAGYLPRVAYNLDRHFQKCHACGKQSLTMLQGFGCNAVGVTGCRIIDSPRERLIAILTNCFIPCNGRFPTLLALITIFFAGGAGGLSHSFLPAVILTGVIVFAIANSFAASRFLSATFLKGELSSFTLELPPYRRPQILKTLVRSLLDRTIFVLARAIKAAAPAGLIIWILANIPAGEATLLQTAAAFLDPLGKLLGMDGMILLAFILGLPANEIVMPIIIMGYSCGGILVDAESLISLQQLLSANGWTWLTACCTIVFFLMHWPCATTLITIHKETKSIKWTALAFLLPTVWGMTCCFIIATLGRIFL